MLIITHVTYFGLEQAHDCCRCSDRDEAIKIADGVAARLAKDERVKSFHVMVADLVWHASADARSPLPPSIQ